MSGWAIVTARRVAAGTLARVLLARLLALFVACGLPMAAAAQDGKPQPGTKPEETKPPAVMTVRRRQW